jgi:predicted amidohydrolase
MELDILIKNGHVVDPAGGIDGIMDIGTSGNRIADMGCATKAEKTFDASGCYIFPGLIDFHTHCFHRGTKDGYNPAFLPGTGVTATVDGGSSGCWNFPVFHDAVIAASPVRIKAFLSFYPTGVKEKKPYGPTFHPSQCDRKGMKDVIARFPGVIIGIKARNGADRERDLQPLAYAFDVSSDLGDLPLCVHMTDPVGSMGDVVNMLRKGDIFCHVYHGTGETILNREGSILDEVRRARERGVLFDMSCGVGNYSHNVCRAALAQGFRPDIISTDMGIEKLFYSNRVRSLPYVMSRFLSFGMELVEVVRCTTQTPAALMGMAGRIGTLAPGAFADISVMRLTDTRTVQYDTTGNRVTVDALLVPQFTIVDGEPAFSQIDFNNADHLL